MEEQNNQSKLEKRIAEVDNNLELYLNSLGVSENKKIKIDEIKEYLEMDRHELKKLSETDCLEIAYRLAQLSLEIQREHNRLTAKSKWAESQIKKLIADKVGGFKGYSYEERFHAAVKENDVASKLNVMVIDFNLKANSITFIANEIKNLANILQNLQREKRNNA